MVNQENDRHLYDVGTLFFVFQEPGDELDGTYHGFRWTQYPDGKYGKVHHVANDTGVYGFSGTYQLDENLARVAPYAEVVITYAGQTPTKRGLNPVKLFKVRTTETEHEIPALEFGNGVPPLPLSDAKPAGAISYTPPPPASQSAMAAQLRASAERVQSGLQRGALVYDAEGRIVDQAGNVIDLLTGEVI